MNTDTPGGPPPRTASASLGEDPHGYRALLDELTRQLGPKNRLEQHYTEKIAAASWRLRRLQRWQAQLFEDPRLTEDEVLSRLDRVMRHETTLHRQIDTSVKMMGRDVPHLFESRARKEALAMVRVTERDCARDENADRDVEINTREKLDPLAARPDLDQTRLDNCQNEPVLTSLTPRIAKERPGEVLPGTKEVTIGARLALPHGPEGVPLPRPRVFCQNEPAKEGASPTRVAWDAEKPGTGHERPPFGLLLASRLR